MRSMEKRDEIAAEAGNAMKTYRRLHDYTWVVTGMTKSAKEKLKKDNEKLQNDNVELRKAISRVVPYDDFLSCMFYVNVYFFMLDFAYPRKEGAERVPGCIQKLRNVLYRLDQYGFEYFTNRQKFMRYLKYTSEEDLYAMFSDAFRLMPFYYENAIWDKRTNKMPTYVKPQKITFVNYRPYYKFGLVLAEKGYPDDNIGVYAGSIVGSRANKDSIYRYQYDSNTVVDADRLGNRTRFINDLYDKGNCIISQWEGNANPMEITLVQDANPGENLSLEYGVKSEQNPKGYWKKGEKWNVGNPLNDYFLNENIYKTLVTYMDLDSDIALFYYNLFLLHFQQMFNNKNIDALVSRLRAIFKVDSFSDLPIMLIDVFNDPEKRLFRYMKFKNMDKFYLGQNRALCLFNTANEDIACEMGGNLTHFIRSSNIITIQNNVCIIPKGTLADVPLN